jgi:hypothetical protein
LKGQACVRYQIKSNQNPFIASWKTTTS